MRVFGSPAQIFLRGTVRQDQKLSDRSVSGTFIGISDKGNGYIFLVQKSNELVEVDTKDAKFNKTFSDCRERQGKLVNARNINPNLMNVTEVNEQLAHEGNDGSDENGRQLHQRRSSRQTTAVKFLLPGTRATSQSNAANILSQREMDIRKTQYANIGMEKNDDAFVFACMEAQIDEETSLMKELELLNACRYNDKDNDVLMAAIKDANEVNLSIADPKSQNDIDKMDPRDAKRFNDATFSEVRGMQKKQVFEYTTMDNLPQGTKVYQSIVNWTSKTNLGKYVKTKCRICFGGHIYDKSYSDTFAPTVNFCTVLVIICLSAMFGWYLGSLDYSQAYLNAVTKFVLCELPFQ
jgi:hypothetical protein